MELLQKLTLYDLLGYAVPGSVMLFVWSSPELDVLLTGGVINAGIFLVLAFIVGIMISEIASWLKCAIDALTRKRQWERISRKSDFTREKVEHALVNAHVINQGDGVINADNNETNAFEYVRRYFSVMYADIQSDSNYSRIHNYASALLLYKNMTVVALACTILGMRRCSISEIVFGIAGLVCFFIRSCRFNHKQITYTICWYLEKYSK